MYTLNISPQNKRHLRYKLFFGASLILLSTFVFALKKDVEQPVKINADSVLFNKEKGLAVYEGNVSINQGSLQIQANKIEIIAPKNSIERIIATGYPVRFKQTMDDGKLASGSANKVVYHIKSKRVVLDGKANMSQDKDKFSSNHIEYSLQTGELKAGGNKQSVKKSRVNVIFYPTNKAK